MPDALIRFYNGNYFNTIKASSSLASNPVFTLPVDDGNNGEFFQTDGNGVISWATAGGGKLVQIVTHTQTTMVTSTSSSYATTGLTGAITGVVSGNKVYISGLVNAVGPSSATHVGIQIGLFRASTEIQTIAEYAGYNTSSTNHQQPVPFAFLDSSPGSGTVTYTLQFLRRSGSGTARVQVDSAVSTLVLMEIEA